MGQGVSIRTAGTQQNANLAFAKVDHDAGHKVDGGAPALIAADPVSVTSSAGTDSTYAIGDAIDITATFTEPVTATTAGDPVAGPRIAFTLGAATKHAVYHSGNGTSALVFRYTVAEDDADTDGISVVENGLALNGGAIADAAGNAPTAAQLEHPALAAQGSHKVDGVRPTVSGATVDGTALRVTFSEALGAAASLANGAFEVKKTPSGGSETTVSLSGSPSISGKTLTLTLASAVAGTDTNVKVSYTVPTTGTDNTLRDAAGNDATSFAGQAVTSIRAVSAGGAGVDADGGRGRRRHERHLQGGRHGARTGDVQRYGGRGGRPGAEAAVRPGVRREGHDLRRRAGAGRTRRRWSSPTRWWPATLSTQGIAFYANKLSVGQRVRASARRGRSRTPT